MVCIGIISGLMSAPLVRRLVDKGYLVAINRFCADDATGSILVLAATVLSANNIPNLFLLLLHLLLLNRTNFSRKQMI